MTILRAPNAATTYKRDNKIHPSMEAITVDEVSEALLQSMRTVSLADV
jgi:hypothetical protein